MASASLDSIPVKRALPNGDKVLAETRAYVVLERHATKAYSTLADADHVPSLVSEHTVQLLREPTGGVKPPVFKLVVHSRHEGREPEHVVLLDPSTSLTPALQQLRTQTHFVKPAGESLLRSLAASDGQEVKLYTFHLHHGSNSAVLDALKLKQQAVGLGFKDLEEALGWYLYCAACARLLDDEDADFTKALAYHKSLAERAADTHAPLLKLD